MPKTIHTTWETMKHTIDWTAFLTAMGYCVGWVASHFLAILSGTWLFLQIFSWFKNKKWKNSTGDK